MKLSVKRLRLRGAEKLIVESVDLSLYIAMAVVDGRECLVTTGDGRPLRTRNLLDMKRELAGIAAPERVLRQRSAYDEMIGHSWQAADNALELPLGELAPAADSEVLPPR